MSLGDYLTVNDEQLVAALTDEQRRAAMRLAIAVAHAAVDAKVGSSHAATRHSFGTDFWDQFRERAARAFGC